MTTKDRQLIRCAIDNCENRERQTCEDFIKLHPEHQQKFEEHCDIFLFATMMVRMEIERMIEKGEQNI